jgi:general secretion pathway protein H
MTTSAMAKTTKNRHSAGLTLMEVMVAIAIIGIVILAMTGTVGSVFGARLDASANKLSGMVRYAYNLATLKGKVHRLVVNFEDRTYRVEAVEEQKTCGLLSEEEEKKAREDDSPAAAIEELTGSEVKDSRVKTEKLAQGIDFHAIMTRHNSKVVEEGEEAIYFFPDGTAEKALVWLTDGDEVFTVEVTALQGTGVVWSEELDSKELSKK